MRTSQYVPSRISKDRSPAGAACGIRGGTAGGLAPGGAELTGGGCAMRGGGAVGVGSGDNRVESPQCGQGMVSPTALAGNSMCPLQDWHKPFKSFFSLVSTCNLNGWFARAGVAGGVVDWIVL